ncbi:unnamed protein product [Caenorhabditis auriculariae]|uniref:Uncharacterized protein n=1 Tax=Caenorhabditis auriculariae TaxID=2777116 RepID=A0A8S1HMW2_9PELO|nr:unnamed protein product [Caenorhabditis auriculariae]
MGDGCGSECHDRRDKEICALGWLLLFMWLVMIIYVTKTPQLKSKNNGQRSGVLVGWHLDVEPVLVDGALACNRQETVRRRQLAPASKFYANFRLECPRTVYINGLVDADTKMATLAGRAMWIWLTMLVSTVEIQACAPHNAPKPWTSSRVDYYHHYDNPRAQGVKTENVESNNSEKSQTCSPCSKPQPEPQPTEQKPTDPDGNNNNKIDNVKITVETATTSSGWLTSSEGYPLRIDIPVESTTLTTTSTEPTTTKTSCMCREVPRYLETCETCTPVMVSTIFTRFQCSAATIACQDRYSVMEIDGGNGTWTRLTETTTVTFECSDQGVWQVNSSPMGTLDASSVRCTAVFKH